MSGIEVIGLVLALPAVIQVFFQTGEKIHEIIKNDKHMKGYVQDLRKLVDIDGKAHLNRDFELAKGILKDQGIGKDEKDRINRLFSGALKQLEYIHGLADVVQNSNRLEYRKRSAALKDMKDKIIDFKDDMAQFHQLIISLHTISISESSLLLEDQDFVLTGPEQDRNLLNDGAILTKGRVSQLTMSASKAYEQFLLESKPYSRSSMLSIKSDVRFLSQRLAKADQDNGILPLLGFRNEYSKNQFQLVFAVPPSTGPIQTLEDFYETGYSKPSLNTRTSMCCQLAEAVLQTHALGLVHKNIRPDNVLLSLAPQDEKTNESHLTLYLSGWNYARDIDSKVTKLSGETEWQRAIYQHPERQKQHVEAEYCMGHDVYSLGVCMLEILLWDPLVVTNELDPDEASISRAFKAIFEQYENVQKEQSVEEDWENLVDNPGAVQRTMIQMCRSLVPGVAGMRLRDVVIECLTCLGGEADLGSFKFFQERDNKDTALDFIDTILRDIRRVMSAI